MVKKFSMLLAVAAGLIFSGCSSTGGADRQESTTERKIVAMISHGAPGDTFWDLVRKGAEDAANHHNIELRYSADPQAPNQAQLVQAAIDSHVDGIAVTLSNPPAVGPTAAQARNKGIPVVGFNAGMNSYKDYDLLGFFGQDESIAGLQAGQRLAQDPQANVLCVIHEQGNISQEARCAGVEEGLGRSVEILYVNGQDLGSVQATIEAKLRQDPSINRIMTLVSPVALIAVNASQGRDIIITTFDTDDQLYQALDEGTVEWAIDQQPYVQGYMAVASLWMNMHNGSTIGGGYPVYTGPAFIEGKN